MNTKDYEQNKRECWAEFRNAYPAFSLKTTARVIFKFVFKRAYALGKQFGNTEQLNAEGEEMLTVSRKRVQEMYTYYDAVSTDPDRPKDHIESRYEYADGITTILEDLFGSKCLPDNVDSSEANVDNSDGSVDSLEPKSAEPKFKLDDRVKDISSPHDDGIYKVDDIKKSSDGFIYHVQGIIGISDVKESDLELYTEPQEESRNYSQNIVNYDKEFDKILKDSSL